MHPKFPFEIRTGLDTCTVTPKDFPKEVIHKLMKSLRVFVDFLEPGHWRRLLNDETGQLFSYSFQGYCSAAIRWKRGILALHPQNKTFFCLLEWLDYYFVSDLICRLDHCRGERNDLLMAFWLTSFYYVISNMKTSPAVDQAIREHLQSALAHRILHVYRTLLPTKSSCHERHRDDQGFLALILHEDFGTSELFPSGFSDKIRSKHMFRMLQTDKVGSISNEKSEGQLSADHRMASRCSTQPLNLPRAFLPPCFVQVFGLHCWRPRLLERNLSSFLKSLSGIIMEPVLLSAPIALSAAARLLFTIMPFQEYDVSQGPLWLHLTLCLSIEFFELFFNYLLADTQYLERLLEDEHRPLFFSATMNEWVEETDIMRVMSPASVDVIRKKICKMRWNGRDIQEPLVTPTADSEK